MLLKEAIKAVAATRKKKKGREIAEKSIAEKKSTTTSEESDDGDDSLPSSISDEEDKNKNKNKEAKIRGRSSTDSGETFETTTTATNNNGTSEDSDEDDEKKEKNRKRRMRRKGSPTDTDDEEEAYVRELSTQQQRLKKVKRTNMIDTNTAMMTALGGGTVPAAQVAPIAVPQLTLDQIQQLLAQQQLMQMQNLQQQFVLQQQELMRNPPKDFMSALQFLQQQQVQAMYNFNNSGANAASAAVMLNQATSGSLPPFLLNSLSSAMNGGNIGNNALAPLIQEELQLKLKQQQMKEYRKELKKKEKLLEKQKKYPYANKQLENISFKSIMSQQLEGSMDQQMEEDEEGDEERARATVSVQSQSDDSGRIAPKAGASGIGVPTQSAATTTTTITPSLKEQREILNAKNANHKEASQFVSGRACGVQGCELLCEKSRSLVGAVQQCCEMHKREDSFNLKEREGVFRWCFYCHRPQKIEEFSSSSKSICREKFALRKQRRKLASQKQKLLAEASKTQIAMQQYVTVEHLQQQQEQLIEMMQSKQAKSKSSKKKEKRPRTSEEKEAMRALCDILADEERRESEEKQRAEKESSQEDA
ncbi:unnamed protein product [Bathycoccus prasinos]